MNKHPDFEGKGLHTPTNFYWGPDSQIDGNDYSDTDVSLYWVTVGVVYMINSALYYGAVDGVQVLLGVENTNPEISA